MKHTIIVTGGLGHIGSSLIRKLDTSLVERIIIIDNFESQRYASLFDLPDAFEYKFIEDDVRTGDMKKYFADADIVIHLAALTDAEKSKGREKEVEAVNFHGLKRVADACLKTDTKLFFPSTTSVYGSQDNVVYETCTELKPQSPYADSKLKAEKYLNELGTKGLKFSMCRFGTIFGWSVGMRFHTAVNKFTWQAVNGLPITVWKTAWEQKRPYLDLTDCVRAINFIIEKDLFNNELYNVLTHNFTVKDIVETIKEFIPNLEVTFVDSEIMNQLSYDVDDTKFRNLGFEPKGDLKKSLDNKIDHMKGILV